MAVMIEIGKCNGCGICAEICPVEAIIVEEEVTIDAEICVECGACIEECPAEAILMGD